MGRKSMKEIRQKEIVQAFYKVSKTEGLENTSIAKVAKEMDINPSLIIHYFNTKNDLIFGLIQYILESYKLIYTPKDSKLCSKNKLINIINNLFSREWNQLFDDGVFYSCFSLIFRNEKIRTSYKELHEYLRTLLANVIDEAKKDGHIDIENSNEVADLIFILVEGAYYYLSLYEDDEVYQKKLLLYKKSAFNFLKLYDPEKDSSDICT